MRKYENKGGGNMKKNNSSVITMLVFIIGILPAIAGVSKLNLEGTKGKIIENYAHRGCRGLMPENTIPSYKKALEIGVDFVDMDVNMTKDGVVVVTHDPSLNPTITRDKNGKWITSNKLYIKDMTYEELKTYDVGRIKPGTKHAKIFKHQAAVDGTYIPTLKEVIKFIKDNAKTPVKYQIEIKSMPFGIGHHTDSQKLAEAVYKIIKEENIIAQCEIQDFDWLGLLHMNYLDEKVHTAYLLIPPIGIGRNDLHLLDSKAEELCELTTAELEKLEQNNYKILGLSKIDCLNISTYKFYLQFTKAIKDAGGYLVEPMLCFTSKEFIDASHANGLKVVPWDSEKIFNNDFNEYFVKLAIQNNVDGIINDRPDLLNKLLHNNNIINSQKYL